MGVIKDTYLPDSKAQKSGLKDTLSEDVSDKKLYSHE